MDKGCRVKTESIVLGGGCFWCLEAAYQKIPGVLEVESAYSGGYVENPTYKAICAGNTGHAEVVKVTYDSDRVSLSEILAWFWRIHDPTTLNRQGADIGTQYRSVIFYTDEAQESEARAQIEKLEQEKVFSDPIVTQVAPLENYFPAEEYHQNYYNQNPTQGYCSYVIAPKLAKVEEVLAARG